MMKMLSIKLNLNFHFLKLFHLIKFVIAPFIFVLDESVGSHDACAHHFVQQTFSGLLIFSLDELVLSVF